MPRNASVEAAAGAVMPPITLFEAVIAPPLILIPFTVVVIPVAKVVKP